MSEEITLEEYKTAYKEMRTADEQKGFLIHLVVYVLINAMLIAINFLYSPDDIWFFYPLLGWGIGITAHYLRAVRWVESELNKKEAEAEYRARESKRK